LYREREKRDRGAFDEIAARKPAVVLLVLVRARIQEFSAMAPASAWPCRNGLVARSRTTVHGRIRPMILLRTARQDQDWQQDRLSCW